MHKTSHSQNTLKKSCEYFGRVDLQKGYVHIPILLWIMIILTYVCVTPMHTYNDILVTAKQGYNFWNLLAEGRPFDFYMEASIYTGNPYYPVKQGAAYLFPVYFIFAIWNFPTWLIEKLSGRSLFNTIPSMIWMKLMLILFLVVSANVVYGIVNRSEKKAYASFAAFLFSSSIITIYPIAIIGQYDILGMPFLLWGISAWKEKNNRKFIAFFSVAAVFKYFSLLYFLPLLLLREKRLRIILADIIVVLVPSFLFSVIFPKPYNGIGNSGLISVLLHGIPMNGDITLYGFAAAVAFVLIYVYFKPCDKAMEMQTASFAMFAIMAAFCVLENPFPYWVIFASPAFVFVIIFSGKNMNKLLLLETAITWCVTIKNYVIYYWCFCMMTVGGMGLLPKILGVDVPDYLAGYSVMQKFLQNEELPSLLFTASFVGMVTAIWFSGPKSRHNKTWEPLNYGTIYLRTIGNAVLAILPLVALARRLLLR